MRLEQLNNGEESVRGVGAAVVRKLNTGEIVLELGPADGPARLRLKMSHGEAMQLTAAVQVIAQNGGETGLIVED
jgi:hypothetical protein